MYGSRRMFRMEFHLEQDASPGISMMVVNDKQLLQPLSTTASGTDPRAVMKIVRRPDRIITLFDGELDDFLALGIPMPHRIVITTGPRPDDLKGRAAARWPLCSVRSPDIYGGSDRYRRLHGPHFG